MNIKRIWSVYFSATLTTEKVVTAVSEKLAAEFASAGKEVKSLTYDFTTPAARQSFPELNENDLVVFGMPTYAGRLPNLMLKYLDTLNGHGALAIPMVTFGNRSFDNSLIELRNILESHSFHTLAAAACSCEHSFSYELGAGRPDADDMTEIADFAEACYDKLDKALTGYNASGADEAFSDWLIRSCASPVQVPGDASAGYFQPQDRNHDPIDIRKVKPLTNPERCTSCGLCAEICPMGAIDPEDFSKVTGICIKCCACFKRCPAKAKYFQDPGYLYHKSELEYLYAGSRRENTFCL